MSNYTPVPFTIEFGNEIHGPSRVSQLSIAAVSQDHHNWEANAEFIVRACNAHDDMLAALEACLEHPGLDECNIDNVDFGQEPVCETIRLARAAIAKAKGQP